MTKRETLKDKALHTLDLTKESAKQFGKSQYLCCEGHGTRTYEEWVEWENQEVDK